MKSLKIRKFVMLTLFGTFIVVSCKDEATQPGDNSWTDGINYNILKSVKIEVKNDPTKDFLFEYNNNRVVKVTQLSSGGTLRNEITIERDTENNPTSYTNVLLDANGKKVSDRTYYFKYDELNRLIEMSSSEEGTYKTTFTYTGNDILATYHAKQERDNTYMNFTVDPTTGHVSRFQAYSNPTTPMGQGFEQAKIQNYFDLDFSDITTPTLFAQQQGFFNYHNINNIFLVINEFPNTGTSLDRLPFTELDRLGIFEFLPKAEYQKPSYQYQFNSDTTNIKRIENDINIYTFNYQEQ